MKEIITIYIIGVICYIYYYYILIYISLYINLDIIIFIHIYMFIITMLENIVLYNDLIKVEKLNNLDNYLTEMALDKIKINKLKHKLYYKRINENNKTKQYNSNK